LKITFESISELKKYFFFEYIVIDGESNDNSIDLIKENKIIDQYLIEPDNGIYDAMNKGICLAKRQWVLFMNAGDVIFSNDSISWICNKELDKFDIIYGYCFSENQITPTKEINLLKFGLMPFCHQAIFYNRAALEGYFIYDKFFKIYGDYDLMARLFKKNFTMKKIEYVIAKYKGFGISHNISTRKRFEKYYSVFKNFGMINLIKALIYRIKSENK